MTASSLIRGWALHTRREIAAKRCSVRALEFSITISRRTDGPRRFKAVNAANAVTGPCTLSGASGAYALGGTGCLLGGAGATGNIIGSNYKTPYAIHITGGVQHAFNQNWIVSADYTHEQGNHGYRAYSYTSGVNLFSPLIPASDPNFDADQQSVVPNVNVFRSDNRSSYNALMLHCRGMSRGDSTWWQTTPSRKPRPGDACWANCSIT